MNSQWMVSDFRWLCYDYYLTLLFTECHPWQQQQVFQAWGWVDIKYTSWVNNDGDTVIELVARQVRSNNGAYMTIESNWHRE